MSMSLSELIGRLTSEEGIDSIRRSRFPDAWNELLRVCAVAHVFDRIIFEDILMPGVGLADSPRLDELERWGLVEKLPGRAGLFRLEPVEREHRLNTWLPADPGTDNWDRLKRLSTELADHQRTQGSWLEYLRHLMLADPAEAKKLFAAEFDAADRTRDFARFRDALDVLDDPFRIDLAELCALHDERADYLLRQQYWSVDHRRSTYFLPPHGWRELVERLLSGADGVRGWDMFGADGSGKTMSLRWLIARRCVPAYPEGSVADDGQPADIPCARIDLEVVDPVVLARHPWLILLPIARQLQIHRATRHFQWISDRYERFTGLLSRSDSSEQLAAAAQTLPDGPIGEHGRPGAYIRHRATADFIAKLNAASRDLPVVVVIDTIDELLNVGEDETRALLRLLADVHRACPALRLIFAGRHPGLIAGNVVTTGDHSGDAGDADAPVWFAGFEAIEVPGFDDPTAECYLREKRGIDDDESVARGVREAGGSPLALALYAERHADPETDPFKRHWGVTPDDLETAGQHDLPRLIETVLGRISEGAVRWLLRYGVVPRRLRFDAVRDVMLPHLRRGMAGPSEADDPSVDRFAPDVFPHTPRSLDDDELRRVWEELLSYVGVLSFVQYSADDPEAVVFHVSVRRRMREIIATHQVSIGLHRDFADYYRERADIFRPGQRGEWASCYREVLYHEFQGDISRALTEWRNALAYCRQAGALDDLDLLARDLLGEDYRDREGNLVVGALVAAEAELFLAYVAVRRARLNRARAPDPRWAAAARHLGRFEQLRADVEPDPAPRPILAAAVWAALRLGEGSPRDALDIAEQALDAVPVALSGAAIDPYGDVVDLLRVVADCRAALGDDRAIEAYEDALRAIRVRPSDRDEIVLALADHEERRGDFHKAIRALGEEAARPRRPQSAALELRLIQLRLGCADATTDRDRLLAGTDDREVASPAVRAALTHARVEAALLLGDEASAQAGLDHAAEMIDQILGAEKIRFQAVSAQLRGSLYGELLMLDMAKAAFDQAEELWCELGYPAGHPTWRLAYGRFLIRDVGNLARAKRLLGDPLERPADGSVVGLVDSVNDVTVRTWLLAVEAHAAGRQGYDLLKYVKLLQNQLTEMINNRAAPHLAARVAVTGLILSHRQHDGHIQIPPEPDANYADVFADALASQLEMLNPATARLAPLEDLAACHTPHTGSAALGRLLRVVEPADYQIAPPTDMTLRKPLLREAYRICRERPQLGDAPAQRWVLARWRWLRPAGHYDFAFDEHDLDLLRGSDSRLLQLWADKLRYEKRHTENADTTDLRAAMIPDLEPFVADVREDPGTVELESRWAADILDWVSDIIPDSRKDDVRNYARVIYRRLGLPKPQPRTMTVFQDAPGLAVVMPEGLTGDVDDLQRRMTSDEGFVPTQLGPQLADFPARSDADPADSSALRLESNDPFVQMLPWELVPSQANISRSMPLAGYAMDIRWLRHAHRLRVDGADDREAETLRVPRDRSVVVVGPAARSTNATVSIAGSMMFDITREYAVSGCHVHRFERPTRDQLRSLCPGPALLHLQAPLTMIGDTPCLDFSSDGSRSWTDVRARRTDARPRDIVRWVRGFDPGAEPIVVLDPPSPGSAVDFHAQLLLRNLFAALLFQQAVIPMVIAAGLDPLYSRELAKTLAEKIPEGHQRIFTVISGLREQARAARAARATAVFVAASALAPE
ncbi:hypothetical protein [Frankia sp. CiP3]|uniref:tetratricopeptide repeat protein n=1 Tax=Frankia sp. CiP3 TaxID=2880971 RepID=UPI001EF4A87E|nr:hypothetical protein [Frankia sp. CiP3]